MRSVSPTRVWPTALLLLVAFTSGRCSLDEVPLIGHAPSGGPLPDAGADAGDAAPGSDAAVDAGEGCTFAVSAPSEVTLGTRVHVTSDLACVEPAASHTCSWRAQWSDDADEVDTVSTGDHPCATGESFDFTAAASSNDASSVYWVTLEIDDVVTPTAGRAHVYVSEIRAVAIGKKGPGKVADIAIDPATRRAWLATEIGLAALLRFEDENVPLLAPAADRCEDGVVACELHAVAVTEHLAFAGVDGDQDAIVRADVSDGAIVADEIPLPATSKIRSIVASALVGGAGDPALYVSSPTRTWTVARGDLADGGLEVATQLATGGADLAAIVATAVETEAGGGSEALWRLETGGSGELQRLSAIGAGRPSLAPEDILNKSGACLAVFRDMLVVGQRDGRAFTVDLAALDPDAATPLEDASSTFELPIADDPNGALETLDRVVDLFVSEDGDTLWAVSATTLFRVTEGVLFRSRTADVPEVMLSVAALRDADGAEVILIGTDDGVWLTRPDLHPR